MNKTELSLLKDIVNEVSFMVKDFELNKIEDKITLKIYVSHESLLKIVDKYYTQDKPVIKQIPQFDETDEYPLKFYIRSKKYYLHLFRPYLHTAVKDANILVKNMRPVDKIILKILKQIEDENLFKNLEYIVDKSNIKYVIAQKGEL